MRSPVRYLATAGLLMGVAYALLYFRYPAGSWPVALLGAYVRGATAVTGAAVRVFDPSAHVVGDSLVGRFAMRIVLDCAALDAQALFAVAVLAFPSPWRLRAAGVVAGSLALAVANVLRMVALYVIGVRWPDSFHVMHEEVFQFAIVLLAFAAFLAWLTWARRWSARPPA